MSVSGSNCLVLNTPDRETVQLIVYAPVHIGGIVEQYAVPSVGATALGSRPEVGVAVQIEERTIVVPATARQCSKATFICSTCIW